MKIINLTTALENVKWSLAKIQKHLEDGYPDRALVRTKDTLRAISKYEETRGKGGLREAQGPSAVKGMRMTLNQDQQVNKDTIEQIAGIVGIDPRWAVAVALVESSLGLHQKSPTGCRGVFQMSSIAMKDLLLSMDARDDDMIDILCGIAFLWLLYKRHGSIEEATLKYCDPKDRHFYWDRVKKYMEELDD